MGGKGTPGEASKIHDDGLASNLIVGAPAEPVSFSLHGLPMKATVKRIFDASTGVTRLEISNFWTSTQ
jgi:hypothetical protein